MRNGLHTKQRENSVNNDVVLLYTNASSLFNKLGELRVLLQSGSYKLACITETHFHSDILEAEIDIPNFNVFREDRLEGEGGGSLIYVHQSLQAEKLKFFEGCESLAVRLSTEHFKLLIVCFYRSPSLTDQQNKALLGKIRKLPDEDILLVGDVNLPNVDWKIGKVNAPQNTNNKILLNEMEYLNTFVEKSFHWFIKDTNTRRRLYGNAIQESLLDQVLTNNDALIYSIEHGAPLGKSDHVVLKVKLKLKDDDSCVVQSKKNWSRVNEENVLSWSSNIDWSYSDEANSVEKMWEELFQKLNGFSDTVPEEIVKFDKSGNRLRKLPWDCSKLIRKRKEKDKAWKKFESEPSRENYHYALFKQDEFETAEFESKAKHEKRITKNLKSNTKPLFRYLRMKSKIRKTVSKIKKSDGNDTKSPSETSDEFAKFFQSVFRNEEYGPLTERCYSNETDDGAARVTINVSGSKISEYLKSIDCSKSCGPHHIHPKLLKYLAENLAFVQALVVLFIKCIEEEHIPDAWKLAHVVPIHKKGQLSDVSNYRPISLLCIISKIYEKVIRQHLIDTISHKICKEQHGFVKGKSCLSNLLESLYYVSEVMKDEGNADIIFFDFQKAFDQVSHHRLLIKMKTLELIEKPSMLSGII